MTEKNNIFPHGENEDEFNDELFSDIPEDYGFEDEDDQTENIKKSLDDLFEDLNDDEDDQEEVAPSPAPVEAESNDEEGATDEIVDEVVEAETETENEDDDNITYKAAPSDSMKKAISADLIRGHINTIILNSLSKGDLYGFDIIKFIKEKSHGQYDLKQPTLYSALNRLEKQGYIRHYWGTETNGGRRKYFSLTHDGKVFVAQNQAEWEYSRTIIDSLISTRDFDFSQPVPQKLDFRILKQSTSRTPIVTQVGGDGYEEIEKDPNATPDIISEERPGYTVVLEDGGMVDSQGMPYAVADEQKPAEAEPAETNVAAEVSNDTITQTVPEEPIAKQADEPAPEPTPTVIEANNEVEPVAVPVEEPKTEPETIPSTPSNTEAQNDEVQLFLNRSEAERNYKDILGNIYLNTFKRRAPEPIAEPIPTPVEPIVPPMPAPVQPEIPVVPVTPVEPIPAEPEYIPPVQPAMETNVTPEKETASYSHVKPMKSIDFSDIQNRATNDGIRVWFSDNHKQTQTLPEDFFNKGLTLMRSAFVFFLFAILESIFVILFKDNLFASNESMTLPYIVTMLVLTCLVPAVCSVLYFAKFQPRCKRVKNKAVIETGIILFVTLFILLVVIDLLFEVKLNNLPTIMYAFVIPSVYLINIPIFAFAYYLFSRSKV